MSDFSFKYTLMSRWPPLAWLAICEEGTETVQVLHGSRVEVRNSWFCEAIWDGPFGEGRVDDTDVIFGSGARCTPDGVHFVSSCSATDRLQYVTNAGQTFVSNSLVGLFATCDLTPRLDYDGYYEDFRRIVQGELTHQIPADPSPATLVYMYNMRWDGKELHRYLKLRDDRDFSSFRTYKSFLDQSLSRLTENLADPARRYSLDMMGTLSSGYDSTAVAALLRPFGLRQAITITQARGGMADTGAEAARALEIDLHHIRRDSWRKATFPEVPFLATDAKGEDIFFTEAASLLSGNVLFTAYNGDPVWGRKQYPSLQRGDRSGLSLTEFRLWKGFIHAPVPFLGCVQTDDTHRISSAPEMKPWDIDSSYSRPIPRRIAEEAGVPREAFGIEKKAASVLFQEPQISPWTVLSRRSYLDFLGWLWQQAGSGGIGLTSLGLAGLVLKQTTLGSLARAGTSVAQKLPPKLARFWKVVDYLYCWAGERSLEQYLFPWAMERAKAWYAKTPTGETQPNAP